LDRTFTQRQPSCRKSSFSLVPTTGRTQTAYCIGRAIRCMMKGQQSRSEVTGEVTGQVTGEVERLVLALEGSMSRAQIQKALSLRHENHFRQPAATPAHGEGRGAAGKEVYYRGGMTSTLQPTASTQETRPGCAIPLRAR
jgi:hypothetical protein